MPTDTLKIKERLTARGNFTSEQADDIVKAFFSSEDEALVTRGVLASEMEKLRIEMEKLQHKTTIRILLGVVGIVSAVNALFLFVAAAII